MRLTARDAAIRRIEDKLEKNWTKGAVVLGLAFGNWRQALPCLNETAPSIAPSSSKFAERGISSELRTCVVF
jgi:hypothetical protein